MDHAALEGDVDAEESGSARAGRAVALKNGVGLPVEGDGAVAAAELLPAGDARAQVR